MERLSAAERVIALTRRTHDVDREMEARLARLHALVELWRVQDASVELASCARLAGRLNRPDLQAFVASRRAMLAEIVGRFDEASRHGELAYDHAVEAGMPDAERLRMAHRWQVDHDCGTGSEVFELGAVMLRQLAAMTPGHYLEADVAAALLALGRRAEARAELARALPALLTTAGYRWLHGAVVAAEVAAEVGTDETLRRLYDARLPHQDRLVCLGPTFAGPVRHRIGVLALRLGRPDEAVEHLRRTVAELDAVAALPWSARARVDLAEALRAAGDPAGANEARREAIDVARAIGMTRLLAEIEPAQDEESVTWSLTRDGDGWVLDAGSERARLHASRGLDHLAVLLANPGQDIPADQLDAGEEPVPAQSGLPTLDAQAAREYRRRLARIQEEQDSADHVGDELAAQRLAEARDFLLAELRRATGLGGRPRSTGGSTERARVNVTRNLKRSLDQVRRAAPIVGLHLVASIRTGLQCRYEPAPGGPARWRVGQDAGRAG